MSGIELKPCPFCGGKAEQQNYVLEAVVHCSCCFAVIRRTHARDADTGIPASAAAWDTRAALTPPEGYVPATAILATATRLRRLASAASPLGRKAYIKAAEDIEMTVSAARPEVQ